MSSTTPTITITELPTRARNLTMDVCVLLGINIMTLESIITKRLELGQSAIIIHSYEWIYKELVRAHREFIWRLHDVKVMLDTVIAQEAEASEGGGTRALVHALEKVTLSSSKDSERSVRKYMHVCEKQLLFAGEKLDKMGTVFVRPEAEEAA